MPVKNIIFIALKITGGYNFFHLIKLYTYWLHYNTNPLLYIRTYDSNSIWL